MDWYEIAKIGIPTAVGAGSAILSALLTHYFAERMAVRESETKRDEMQQRLVESLLPSRLQAYEELFHAFQTMKDERVQISEVLEKILPNLLWIDKEFTAQIIAVVSEISSNKTSDGERTKKLSALQEELRALTGCTRLNTLFRRALDEK